MLVAIYMTITYFPVVISATAVVLILIAAVNTGRFNKSIYIPLNIFLLTAFFIFSAFRLRTDLAIIITICLLIAAVKRTRFETGAGILLNIATLIIFSLFTGTTLNHDVVQLIKTEKYVKPIFLFSDNYNKQDAKLYNGLNRIVVSRDERYVYFTAKESRKDGIPQYDSLFRIELDRPENIKTWHHDRLFDLALIDNDTKLLATDYKNDRLWLLNAETLKPIRSVATKPRPLNIVTDEKHRRFIVTHEGLTSFLIFSLPNLRLFGAQFNHACPEWVTVDPDKNFMYSSNVCSLPFLLSEVDLRTLKTTRKQFPLRFISFGNGLDRKRGRIYVSVIVTGRIRVVDQKTFRRIGAFMTKPGVRSVVFDEKRDVIYVGNMIDPYLRVYGSDYSLLGKIYIGRICRVIYISPKSNRVFAGSMYGLLEIKIDDLLRDSKKKHKPQP
ncbi:MAG: hypothetical protein WCX65_14800 [bacterium]